MTSYCNSLSTKVTQAFGIMTGYVLKGNQYKGDEIMIDMQQVSKTYDNGSTALKDVTVHIGKGEFVYVVGPSGAGKSTFIRLLNREILPTTGQIQVGDFDLNRMKKKEVPHLRRFLSIVYQDFKLLQKKTVYENVAFAMEVVGENRRTIKNRTMEVLSLVGLDHKADMYPSELSGGEQQRVAIGRSIVNMPQVVIADEPTGNLDPDTSVGIMEIFETINNQGTTVIMATHNREIVNAMKHRVIAIDQGTIVRDEERGDYGFYV